MTTALERKEDGSITLTITIPWHTVAKVKDAVTAELLKKVEIPGFRKGKAPRDLAEKRLDAKKIYEDVLQKILPTSYADAVAEHNLTPVVLPSIEIVEAKEGSDWVIRAHTAEKPPLTLGDYKKAIRDRKAAKAPKIWKPGEEEKEPEPVTVGELLDALYGAITCHIPDILIEQEVNRRLSELIDQTQKLGLTVDQYLASMGRTPEGIRKEYADTSRRTLTLEFALEEIADAEGILVSDDDIEAALRSAKTEEERATLTKQRYYLASILRRQKTLDFLSAL